MNIKDILKQNYGFEVLKITKLDGGFRNSCFKIDCETESFVFIIYKAEKNIKSTIINAHFTTEYLSDNGFPVRVPIKTKSGEEVSEITWGGGRHFAALYNFLEGVTIPWEAYTRRHIKSIGKTLSDMHFYLRDVDIPDNVRLPDWYLDTIKEVDLMKKYFKEVEPWIEKKLKVKLNWTKLIKLYDFIKSIKQQNFCILHYDFVRGNILFSRKLDKKLDIYPICGILDFEKVCVGPKIADIARTLAFLIIDCKYKDESTVRRRFLKSGYIKRGKSKFSVTKKELDNLIQYFWLRDFWKFLVHNPYEYLHMNEHYKRTIKSLINVNLVKDIPC